MSGGYVASANCIAQPLSLGEFVIKYRFSLFITFSAVWKLIKVLVIKHFFVISAVLR